MTSFEKQLAETVQQHGSPLKPRPGWKNRVWQQALSEPPSARRFYWLSAAAAALTVLCVGLGVWNYQLRLESKAHSQAAQATIDEVDREIRRYSTEIDKLVIERDLIGQQAAAAPSVEERRLLEEALLNKEKALLVRRAALKKLRSLSKSDSDTASKNNFPTCDPNDPLCGL